MTGIKEMGLSVLPPPAFRKHSSQLENGLHDNSQTAQSAVVGQIPMTLRSVFEQYSIESYLFFVGDKKPRCWQELYYFNQHEWIGQEEVLSTFTHFLGAMKRRFRADIVLVGFSMAMELRFFSQELAAAAGYLRSWVDLQEIVGDLVDVQNKRASHVRMEGSISMRNVLLSLGYVCPLGSEAKKHGGHIAGNDVVRNLAVLVHLLYGKPQHEVEFKEFPYQLDPSVIRNWRERPPPSHFKHQVRVTMKGQFIRSCIRSPTALSQYFERNLHNVVDIVAVGYGKRNDIAYVCLATRDDRDRFCKLVDCKYFNKTEQGKLAGQWGAVPILDEEERGAIIAEQKAARDSRREERRQQHEEENAIREGVYLDCPLSLLELGDNETAAY